VYGPEVLPIILAITVAVHETQLSLYSIQVAQYVHVCRQIQKLCLLYEYRRSTTSAHNLYSESFPLVRPAKDPIEGSS
jgi:hypothetical protein